MSSYSESISKENLKEIQGKLISYCKDNEGYGEEWRQSAIRYEGVLPDYIYNFDEDYLKDLLKSKGFIEKDGEYVKADDESIKANIDDIQYNDDDTLVNYRGLPLDANFQLSRKDKILCAFIDDLLGVFGNYPEDFKEVYIDYIMSYDIDVIRSLIYTDYCTYSYLRNRPSVTVSLLEDEEKKRTMFNVLDELCPNPVEGKYTWSSSKKAGVLKKVLYDSVITAIAQSKGISFDNRTITHVHMENEKLMYRFYGNDVFDVSADETEEIYAATRELMKCLQDFKKPIKELYAVGKMSEGLYIARKNPDGEYTLTVY